MTLSQMTVQSGRWSTISQTVRQMLLLIVTLVLTHLLPPSAFGIITMATTVSGFAMLLKDLGTGPAIIQRRTLSAEFLSSMFWLNVGIGIVLTCTLILLAPLLALLFNEPALREIISTLAFIFVFIGAGSVHQALLERQLAFKRLAICEIIGVILGATVGIGAALSGVGVWSLVYQQLSIFLSTTALLWMVQQWLPQFVLRWSEIRTVSSFSLNIVGFNVFNYFARNADYLLIGRYLGATELGFYSLAYRMMLYPLQNITGALGRVIFPAFAQLQDDNARLRNAYLRVVSTIALITVPLMLGLLVCSEPLVAALFGPAWSIVALLLTILAPVGMIQSIVATVGAIYQAKGRSDLLLKWGVVMSIIVILSFLIGLPWGIVGVASAYAVASFLLILPNLWMPFRLIELPLSALWGALWRPLVAGLLMLLGLLAVRLLLPANLLPLVQLMLLVPTGALIYLAASWWLNREQMQQALVLVRGGA
jgi:PST family polysaccharide transporter